MSSLRIERSCKRAIVRYAVNRGRVASIFGSFLLGCGLFALAVYSDKSGYDDIVSDATHGQDTRGDEPRRERRQGCSTRFGRIDYGDGGVGRERALPAFPSSHRSAAAGEMKYSW